MNTTVTKPLTLSGRYFSKKDLIFVQEIVRNFPNLSLTELSHTICENLNWKNANKINKHNSCLNALEKMEKKGLLNLPKKIVKKKRTVKKIVHTKQSDKKNLINCNLEQLADISLKVITSKEDISLWNEYIDRYHYLGFKQPIANHIKYFIISKKNDDKPQILGCLLLSTSPVWNLSDRDLLIGWNNKDKEKRLNLILNNNRFLILPWVQVSNLASKVLAILANQIQQDWINKFNYKPVLLETFVDSDKYQGTCYKSANWQIIGKTSGKDWSKEDANAKTSKKYIFVSALDKNYKAILTNSLTKQHAFPQTNQIDSSFLSLWGEVVSIIAKVAIDFDLKWQKRKRVIDSLLLIFLIFRLVFSKNSQSYGITIKKFWHNCHKMKFPLPQKKPISASSFSDARKKLDASIFLTINKKIINSYEQNANGNSKTNDLWLGHQLFAVDGSILNLPKSLENSNYKASSSNCYYPQGLLSCLYQLKSQIPYDFDLVSHNNERKCAKQHLLQLNKNAVVVYDRGYFSYALLYWHIQAGIHPIFRLKRNASSQINEFINSNETEKIIKLVPKKDTQQKIAKEYPQIEFQPLTFRLLRYKINETEYYLGTTLIGESYKLNELKSVYHARWGIEELYKISKQHLEIEDFHGKSENTVKQELFANFVLITMTRLCSNESGNLLSRLFKQEQTKKNKQKKFERKINFKNALLTLSSHLEALMFIPAQHIKTTMQEIVLTMSKFHQKIRNGRSYERVSLTPSKKWKMNKHTA